MFVPSFLSFSDHHLDFPNLSHRVRTVLVVLQQRLVSVDAFRVVVAMAHLEGQPIADSDVNTSVPAAHGAYMRPVTRSQTRSTPNLKRRGTNDIRFVTPRPSKLARTDSSTSASSHLDTRECAPSWPAGVPKSMLFSFRVSASPFKLYDGVNSKSAANVSYESTGPEPMYDHSWRVTFVDSVQQMVALPTQLSPPEISICAQDGLHAESLPSHYSGWRDSNRFVAVSECGHTARDLPRSGNTRSPSQRVQGPLSYVPLHRPPFVSIPSFRSLPAGPVLCDLRHNPNATVTARVIPLSMSHPQEVTLPPSTVPSLSSASSIGIPQLRRANPVDGSTPHDLHVLSRLPATNGHHKLSRSGEDFASQDNADGTSSSLPVAPAPIAVPLQTHFPFHAPHVHPLDPQPVGNVAHASHTPQSSGAQWSAHMNPLTCDQPLSFVPFSAPPYVPIPVPYLPYPHTPHHPTSGIYPYWNQQPHVPAVSSSTGPSQYGAWPQPFVPLAHGVALHTLPYPPSIHALHPKVPTFAPHSSQVSPWCAWFDTVNNSRKGKSKSTRARRAGGVAVEEQSQDAPNHRRSGSQGGLHRCPLCPRSFALANGLVLHLKWHWGASGLDWKRGEYSPFP